MNEKDNISINDELTPKSYWLDSTSKYKLSYFRKRY